jgi:hypothetical protein
LTLDLCCRKKSSLKKLGSSLDSDHWSNGFGCFLLAYYLQSANNFAVQFAGSFLNGAFISETFLAKKDKNAGQKSSILTV